jgi:hypothetical protein
MPAPFASGPQAPRSIGQIGRGDDGTRGGSADGARPDVTRALARSIAGGDGFRHVSGRRCAVDLDDFLCAGPNPNASMRGLAHP